MQRRPSTRTPLLPKELIVPLCQRLILLLFAMCSVTLGIRLFNLWKMGKLGGRWRSIGGQHVNGTHFFLDIGSGNNGVQGFSHTYALEEKGWHGVCADPFPDLDRKCTAISLPITPVTGQSVTLNDCREQSSPLQVVLMATTANCPTVDRAGISIVDALKIADVPHVIDFVSLATQGNELAILKRFPFEDFCVRAWTVMHHAEAESKVGIRSLLEAQQCTLKEEGAIFWARCPCTQFAESLLTTRAMAHHEAVGKNSKLMRSDMMLVQTRRKDKQKHKPSADSMVPGLSLPEKKQKKDDMLAGRIASGVAEALLISPLA